MKVSELEREKSELLNCTFQPNTTHNGSPTAVSQGDEGRSSPPSRARAASKEEVMWAQARLRRRVMDNPVVAQLNHVLRSSRTLRETGVTRHFSPLSTATMTVVSLPMSSRHYGCVQACDVCRHVGGECCLLYRAPTVAFPPRSVWTFKRCRSTPFVASRLDRTVT